MSSSTRSRRLRRKAAAARLEVDAKPSMSCDWCRVPVQQVRVLVGALPGHYVNMLVDLEPSDDDDPERRVIKRSDGVFRLLGRVDRRAVPGYRPHGHNLCGPNYQRPE